MGDDDDFEHQAEEQSRMHEVLSVNHIYVLHTL